MKKIGIIIWGFVAAAFVGWIYEETCMYILYGHFSDRGILHLPICPIYGFGLWLLYPILHKIKNVPLLVILAGAISGIFEYISSLILEKCFNLKLWTYRGWLLSINDRVSMISCLIFGIMAAVFIKVLLPLISRISKRISEKIFFASAVLILAIIIADFIIVCIK
ncbi:MAG: putative ABC transporter permease [Lachnospiraceae bacterium]|nr:putative ABC transporter permease [Lachnospiraceae bacterium]